MHKNQQTQAGLTNSATGNKYRFVVFLDDEGSERSQKILERFAQSTRVLYVTSKKQAAKDIDSENIKIYSFDTLLNRLHRVFYSFNTHLLAEEIDKICRESNINMKEVLIFANTLNYGNIILSFQGPGIHFDLNSQQDNQPIADLLLKKNLYRRIRTISTSKTSLVKGFQKYFRASFKIADGLSIQTFEQQNNSLAGSGALRAGCYCYNPDLLDIELVRSIARAYPQIEFAYFSDKLFNQTHDMTSNVQFFTTDNWYAHLDLVILPVIHNECPQPERFFYENLIYQAPILTLDHSELPSHRDILHKFNTSHDISAALNSPQSFKHVNRPQANVLLQSTSWQARLNQLEGIIISH